MSLLSGVYGRAARFRRAWYGRHPARVRQLDHPVISVGNLVTGGSGKTPVVAALAKMLLASGEQPVILSRGYGRTRSADRVVIVSDGTRVLVPVRESGDEPQMLARALAGVPILVSADRYLAGRTAERQFRATVHLLDDGYQHFQLARDVNLLVMSSSDFDEQLLPTGRLREPLDAASAADALLVAGSEDDASVLSSRTGVSPAFQVRASYGQPAVISGRRGEEYRRVVAVAAIARPERFFSALAAEGWDVARRIVFRDHHWFSDRDIAAVRQAATQTGATLIVTTEKDAVRLEPGRLAPEGDSTAAPWAYLPMHVAIEPAAFETWIAARLAEARRRRAAA
jgi:tetraacyldisaccharide 4'-kinase